MVWTSPFLNHVDSRTNWLTPHYGQLPDINLSEPVEAIVDSPNVKFNKTVDVKKETPSLFPTKREELLQIYDEPDHIDLTNIQPVMKFIFAVLCVCVFSRLVVSDSS